MPSPGCKLYALFISCIISLVLAIGTLVVNIVFKYIGFVDSDAALGLCTQTYLMEKYRFLLLHLQTAFVGICLNILMNCIVLCLLIITLKNLKSANLNPQLQTETLPQSVISKVRIAAIYIMNSLGALGAIICFGYYLSLYFAALKDPLTCSFSYNDGKLLILMIISGVWLMGMIVQYVFVFAVNNCVSQQDAKDEREDKYKQMINVTEEPGVTNQYGQKLQDNIILKGAQFTEEPSNGELHSFGNQKNFTSKMYQSKQMDNDQEARKNDNYILKDMESSQVLKPNDQTQSNNFGVLKNEQNNSLRNFGFGNPSHLEVKNRTQPNRINKNEAINGHKFYSRQIEQPEQKVTSNLPITNINTNTNQYSSKLSPTKSPGKFYNSTNNQNIPSVRTNSYQNQPEYNNPFSKPLSPIKQLNESVLDNPASYSTSPIKDDPFKNVEMFTVHRKGEPQRAHNKGNGRDVHKSEFYDEEDNTKGQLMFQIKPVEFESRQNRVPDIYKNEIQRFDKNSSGEVSFKSPSRFDNKFAQEQNKYLSRNTLNSILPGLNKIKQSEGSRRNGYNDNYSSSGINSYFAQSRGRDSNDSPTSKYSRTRTREGVLTSFIRGKFV